MSIHWSITVLDVRDLMVPLEINDISNWIIILLDHTEGSIIYRIGSSCVVRANN